MRGLDVRRLGVRRLDARTFEHLTFNISTSHLLAPHPSPPHLLTPNLLTPSPLTPQETPVIPRDGSNQPRSGDTFIAWGVSPRNTIRKKTNSRGAATDNQRPITAAHSAAAVCRPLLGALAFCFNRFLGLTPQAMSLSRLRRSNVCQFLRLVPRSPRDSFLLGLGRAAQGGVFLTSHASRAWAESDSAR